MSSDDRTFARTLKEQGNEAFKKKRYYTAIEKYSKSLSVYPDPVVLSNRAQAELNTNLNILAQIDCTAAIGMDASIDKTYFRRAQAFKALGLYELALQDAIKCKELSTKNADIDKLVEELSGKKNVALLETFPIRRDDYIQSQQKFMDIQIEYNKTSRNVNENSSQKQPQGAAKISMKKIPSIPKEYQDFVAGVSYLKDDPLLLAEYFLRVDPSAYHRIFDDMLDNENAACVVEALLYRLEQGQSNEGVGERLIAISRVRRFELVIALMNDKDRKTINSICNYLTPEDAAIVRIKYDC